MLVLYKGFLALTLIGSLINLVPTWHWLQLWNQSFSHYYLGAHLISIFLLGIWQRYFTPVSAVLTAALLCALSTFYTTFMWPFVWEQPVGVNRPAPPAEQTFRVFSANVDTYWGDKTALGQMVKSMEPDVVGLFEINNLWDESLKLYDNYPYEHTELRDDGFGIGVYSRFPWIGPPQVSIGEGLPPVIDVTLAVADDKPVRLLMLHTPMSRSQDQSHRNSLTVRRIASLARHSEGRAVVLADLGTTPFSQSYRLLTVGGRLRDAMIGRGWLKTWHGRNEWLWLPVSYIMTKGPVEPLGLRTLPPFNSDRIPLVADLRLDLSE